MTARKKRRPSISELRESLSHIRALIFGSSSTYDTSGRLVSSSEEAGIIFDDLDGEDTAEVEKLRAEIDELHALAYRDELTGILNRRGVKEEFGDLFDEAHFSKEHPDKRRKGVVITDFSIIFIDLDDFKNINDTYGHEEGDRVLIETARILEHHVRGIDAVGRLGGEEFVVALLGADEDDAHEKAKDIKKAFKKSLAVGEEKHPVTASIGVASLHHSNAHTLDDLIDRADKAMYEAKANRGKNTIVKYNEIRP